MHKTSTIEVRSVSATRYVLPLREGGSLPGLMEADDDGLYVVKYRGAGQGPKALVAELITGLVGQVLRLNVPELVLADLPPAFGRIEPDPEIADLLESASFKRLPAVKKGNVFPLATGTVYTFAAAQDQVGDLADAAKGYQP